MTDFYKTKQLFAKNHIESRILIKKLKSLKE